MFSRKQTFTHDDLAQDPWSVLYKEVPTDADFDLLNEGYVAARWCRQKILENVNADVNHVVVNKNMMDQYDKALSRLREIVRLMRQFEN